MRRPLAVMLFVLLGLAPLTGSAQAPSGAPDPKPPETQPAEPEIPARSVQPDLPTDPVERLEMARAAFRRADYGLLVPLLESLTGSDSPLQTVDARVEARELVVVGYFFLAQQVTTSTDRGLLLTKARAAALDLLRERPEHTLDALIFPVSVVDLFEAVRAANAEELDRLLAERRDTGADVESETVYLERVATRHLWWVNLLPFGAGQFQNGNLVTGTTLAILQAAGLALDVTSYFMILRLRDPATGRFSSEGALDSDLASAKRWRQALYGGLAGFALTWAISIVDAWYNFETETVRIRTLDAPPPELGGPLSDSGLRQGLPLGLSLEFRW